MKEEKHWILLSKKVAGEATLEELEELKELLNADPEWKAALENLQEFWASLPAAASEGREQKRENAYSEHINRLKMYVSDFSEADVVSEDEESFFSEPVKRPFYKSWMTYALLAFCIAVVVLLYPSLVNNNKEEKEEKAANSVNEIAISPGSKSKVQLPDGSQVWINAGSKLTYAGMMKGLTREVTLDGEAYFDIVKDATHPFIVHTSGIDIKVLGTAFNVKAYKIEPTIEATLIHGSIEVTNRNRPDAPTIMLKPREKLVFSNDIYMERKNVSKAISLSGVNGERPSSILITPLKRNIADSSISETAWIYNRLSFEDKSFEELAKDMERWYNVKFIFRNKKIAQFHFTGSFINETIEQVLEALRFSINFKYTITDGSILIE
jgi:transmembrane sensor